MTAYIPEALFSGQIPSIGQYFGDVGLWVLFANWVEALNWATPNEAVKFYSGC